MKRIRDALEKNFSADIKEEKGKLTLCYGALKRLSVWIENKKLCVETESFTDADDEVILDTNRRYRKFLEDATGYTTKERLKKLKKDVEG